jgi:NAD(P)-dependent dehydrogenase (short-subunit alcohol dehydrogenase family)/class 3 adenylate cyclase
VEETYTRHSRPDPADLKRENHMYSVNHDLMAKFGLLPRSLADRTALITGGARGIGEGLAWTLAKLGAQVVIVDVLPGGQDVADQIKRGGGRARFVQCDLSDVDQLMAMLPEATSAFGEIDILVNNALHLSAAPVVAFPLDEFEKTFATNARAPFLTMKHLLPGMLERGNGVIVNVIAYEGSPMAVAYSGTKMALRSMAFTAAREIGNESGVSIFSFVPGIVDTPLIHEVILPQSAAALGITEAEVLPIIAHNPGYPGLMPVDHCATALAYAIAHAPEYHGQVADPFEPLDRIGVIEMPRLDPDEASDELDVSGPLSGLYIKQYLGEVTSQNKELEHRIEVRTRELEEARRRSEELLLNILPSPIAKRLEQGEGMIADHFADVTVLFADIVDFTPMSSRLTPGNVVELLDAVFTEFDKIAAYYELEKIKTIGDCYMAVGGIPVPSPDHAERVASAALDMLPALSSLGTRLELPLSVRIGLHSGDVVAGVIGRQKFIYDLWGDTVNTASRMESQGLGDHIQCTAAVRSLLEHRYEFEPRGDVEVKGKGLMPTFFLMGAK